MKTKVLTSIILVAMILTTVLTGCGATDTNKDTATVDQAVVATEETTAPTEAETEEETEAPTEKETEADKEKSDADEDNKDKEDSKEDSPASSNTSNNKNNSTSSNTTTTNKKPSSSSNSSSNSGSSSSTNKKPSSNSGSSNNTPQVITDDTPIPHSQLCTDANMQKVTSAINSYFSNLGMIYTPSLNHNDCGWFYISTKIQPSDCSVNYFKSNTIQFFESEANAFLNMCGATYSDLTFYCYAVRCSNGEYDIYFCHE